MTGPDRVVLARAPMRISLAGGGTDIPSYADHHGGLVVSAAIDRHVALALYPRHFTGQVRALLESQETVPAADGLSNRFAAAALKRAGCVANLQIAALSDAPGETGLGGSGAFTVALTHALRVHAELSTEPADLAESASAVEMEDLGRPVGKHDHYMAALGGLQALHIGRDRSVRARPLDVSDAVSSYIRENLLLFYTGQTRDAGRVLAHQHARTRSGDTGTVRALKAIHALGHDLLAELGAGRPEAIGEVLGRHWQLKKQLSPAVSNRPVEDLYALALDAGAVGGKLLGAGGGGFLLLAVASDRRHEVRAAMRARAVRELPFGVAAQGSAAVHLPL